MAAEFDFSEWVDYFGLNTKSAKTLQKAGLTDYNALVGVDENDMEALGLPISQFKCLRAAVDSIRPKISHKETHVRQRQQKERLKLINLPPTLPSQQAREKENSKIIWQHYWLPSRASNRQTTRATTIH